MPCPATNLRSAEISFLAQGQAFYQIDHYDHMPPFLMSLVSVGDHWMYVSSSGGLTAGRVSPENCLFPYETVDKLHDCHRFTGPTTAIRVNSAASIWRPFANGLASPAETTRRLLKHVAGDHLQFEETNHKLQLTFRYSWRTSRSFGFVRKVTLENRGDAPAEIDIVDGLRNLFPYGVPLATQSCASCLVDAYKHSELDAATGVGIFSLTAQILDRAEAAEILRATTAWWCGLEVSDPVHFLSLDGLRAFNEGLRPSPESTLKGERGNSFVYANFRLEPQESRTWYIVADVARDHSQLAWLRKQIFEGSSLVEALEASMERDHVALMQNVASADGLQVSGTPIAAAHHFANVLFNNMRGGVFASNYAVDSEDFNHFLQTSNLPVAHEAAAFVNSLPPTIDHAQLVDLSKGDGSTDLQRLAMEYLPITFSRRHGDPSRPWNMFEIRTHNDDGSRVYHYQGNWRDIFQNWEALCTSFPKFSPSIIAKFLNASTVDGHNPYRITSRGIDWEVPDREDPWSNIGYWGDHQIIYQTKLLEALRDYAPDDLKALFSADVFCYANVPYRIKSFEDIAANSRATIDYDYDAALEIDRRVKELGSDGRLLLNGSGQVVHVGLAEKLLVPVLAKVSNFVVDGGIWLNTQRPEWNDANNALVGSGLSMVTVCYLHRHLALLADVLSQISEEQFSVSTEVARWFRQVHAILEENRDLLAQPSVSDEQRAQMLAAAGRAFSDYRLAVYHSGFSGHQTVQRSELVAFFGLAREYCRHAILANRRPDGLYHAYNLLELSADGRTASVDHLYEMLEGQVASLSSGALDARQANDLLDALFSSKLYREDQRSFMLYPDRELPGFLEKNRIPAQRIESVALLQDLVQAGDRSLICEDLLGEYHFHPDIQNHADLDAKLDALARNSLWSDMVGRDREKVHDIFDEVFHHKTYTGRSGTMYGYEGLGCIYWHMVSKLLLAVQENALLADREGSSATSTDSLIEKYFLVRGGLSADKTPAEYGAVPTDPYSHTPKHRGAQQPGMTGQVKEEILTRRGELGVFVRDGQVHFKTLFLRRGEFTHQPSSFCYFDLDGLERTIDLPADSLALTVCQVPVIYRLSSGDFSIELTLSDGRKVVSPAPLIDAEHSHKLFARTGEITQIDVTVPETQVVRS